MRVTVLGLIGLAIAAGCGSSHGASDDTDGGGGGAGGGGGSRGAGGSDGTGMHGGRDGSTSHPDGSGGSEGGLPPIKDAGAFPPAGNPDGSCSTLSLPSEAQLVDTSKPTTVVGSGTAASCTFDALNKAVTKGGIVTFDCGPDPATIPVTATLTPPVSNDYAKQPSLTIVVDGGNKVTLDGQGAVRILSWVHMGSWRSNKDTLTLQRIRFINGKTTPTEKIPACPASGGIANTACSQGYDDGQGGAVLVGDGNLRVIDSIFENNQAALLGPDTGGGAIYMSGTGSPSFIVHSSFLNNTASNAGGIGMLWAGAFIFNSLFQGNTAVGTGANNVDPTMCTCSNMGNNNQTGSGGNGGAIYKDGGDGVNLTICGSEITGNSSNEFGPAVFLTADGSGAELIIDDSMLTKNVSKNPVWQWCQGVSTDNPHSSGSGSPSPIKTTFCDATGGSCTMTCSS
jgi:predicted outer membrane repeat protein